MKQGQVVNGYRVVTKPGNAGAGKCLWAFAEKDGNEYFIKEFLDPKRPRPESMGTPEDKKKILAQCEKFEKRHWSVFERIDPADPDAGNLVTATDFFFEGSRYYKVTEKLHPTDVDPSELTVRQHGVLLGTLADSLQLLHRLSVVHGDLKPQNVLLHQPSGSDLYTAKLIDFDDAYVAGGPAPREEIGGDALYGAPEWLRYLQDDRSVDGRDLGTAVDMFAFGLITHVYLIGALPGYGTHSSPAEAVNAGTALEFDARLDPVLVKRLRELASPEPSRRPAVADLQDLLADEDKLRLGVPRREDPPKRVRSTFQSHATPPSGSPGASRVRFNKFGKS